MDYIQIWKQEEICIQYVIAKIIHSLRFAWMHQVKREMEGPTNMDHEKTWIK